MPLHNSVSQCIEQRYSCRSYSGVALDASTRSSLESFIADGKGVFNGQCRLVVVASTPHDTEELKGLGTYGFIKGATAFIVGAIQTSEYDMENLGYRMESVILHATSLGLGTCWLGASFTRSTFFSRISCTEQERIPAVVAVGYKADRRRLFESFARLTVGSDKRKPFQTLFFDGNFQTPLYPQNDPVFAHALEMVRIGPSSTNRQPWRVVRDKEREGYHFFLTRTKNYRERNQLIGIMDIERLDIGIAICHFDLACRERNLVGRWSTDTQPDLAMPSRTSYVATWRPSL